MCRSIYILVLPPTSYPHHILPHEPTACTKACSASIGWFPPRTRDSLAAASTVKQEDRNTDLLLLFSPAGCQSIPHTNAAQSQTLHAYRQCNSSFYFYFILQYDVTQFALRFAMRYAMRCLIPTPTPAVPAVAMYVVGAACACCTLLTIVIYMQHG